MLCVRMVVVLFSNSRQLVKIFVFFFFSKREPEPFCFISFRFYFGNMYTFESLTAFVHTQRRAFKLNFTNVDQLRLLGIFVFLRFCIQLLLFFCIANWLVDGTILLCVNLFSPEKELKTVNKNRRISFFRSVSSSYITEREVKIAFQSKRKH